MKESFWETAAEPWTKAIQSNLIASRKVTNPAIVAQILRHNPKSVLDLGCGEGWISVEMLNRKIQYTGLDGSNTLIELAKSSYPQSTFLDLSYEDIIAGKWNSNNHFDVIVFNFSLFDQNLVPLLSSVKCHMDKTSALIIQTLHPYVTLNPYEDGWRKEDFKSFPVPFEGEMKWYGRTLESWSHTISKSGLALSEVIEPRDPTTRSPLSLILICRSP